MPFRYHGVADVVTYTDDLLTTRKTYDTAKLTLRFNTEERTALVLAQQGYRPIVLERSALAEAGERIRQRYRVSADKNL